jgi:hypothetical protein
MTISRRRKRQLLVWAIAAAGTAYATVGVGSWKYAFVGDEGAFYSHAVWLAEEKKLRVNPFHMVGVYQQHRVLESYIQAIFLFVLGSSVAVWKFSGVAMIFPSVIYMHRLTRRLCGRNAALIAATLLAFSKYLCGFFKIGYTHPLCFALFIISLCFAVELLFAPTKKNGAKFGAALGLSFYAYIGPLFPFFLCPVVLALLVRKRARAIVPLLTGAAVCLAIVSLAFFSTPKESWLTALKKTSASPEYEGRKQMWINVGRNFKVTHVNSDYNYNHYVDGPYVDSVTRWAAALGALICLVRFRRKIGLLLPLWALMCVGLGVTNPYWYTPTTRGFFLVPYAVLFAAIGLEAVRKLLGKFGTRLVIPIALAAAIGLNIYQAQIGLFKRQGHPRMSLILKELTDRNQREMKIGLFYSQRYNFDEGNFRGLLKTRKIAEDRLAVYRDIDAARETDCDVMVVFEKDAIFGGRNCEETLKIAKPGVKVVPIEGR